MDGIHIGKLNGKPAAVHLDGPGGSGRHWAVTIAVSSKTGIIGTCLLTSTIAWRNIHRSSKAVGPWIPLSKDGRLVLWASLQGHAASTNGTFLLTPYVYSLQSGDYLVIDEQDTKKHLLRMARFYEASASEQGRHVLLHKAAALAYRAYAVDGECPMPRLNFVR